VNVIEHLREWSASDEEWAELIEEREKYDLKAFVGDTAEATASANRIADLLESHADRMERSALVRAFTTPTPASLRADAVEWRAGRNPWT
jgi:hypothetical protein